ncbi:DinB family protein [Algoriphagus boritolerans]|uniref:DinB superfamily protein n=1 Tax=Algoriphagus boritolerans DSM 17298 = JCM 18970 TaxID=1120964 RepID=A0A1H6AJ39_9BACT|nr:DinB family protein [Algoriphagus boritolerans]SEG48749.1 DinB superfamily protein [Algoriphagus boritolerans DSM 17298 = JCM 18970]
MEQFVELWKEGRTRFTKLLEIAQEVDLPKRNGQSPNSAGFLIRHIAEVELLFAKNVFGLAEVKIVAKTLIAGKDTGEWTNLAELKEMTSLAAKMLEKAILETSDWSEVIETKEFGKKTKAEAFGRIVTHTAYHAGQLALVLKYGK